jgi:hypothetical protein
MKDVIAWTLTLVFVVCLVWGCFWIAKTLSYKCWYEDMVKQTIHEVMKDGGRK